MKIAILGTRGIPNNYGGFEQCAEYLALGLVKKGHDISVYSSKNHEYKDKTWNNVSLIHCADPEKKLGTIGQFIYDLNCILDARKRSFDIILQLGYTSSSIWGWLLPKKAIITTNMDGLEWKRSKYSRLIKRFLKFAEKLGVKTSDYLISDSIEIKKYLLDKYGKESMFIPYGAEVKNSFVETTLEKFKLKPYNYCLMLARMEPENSVEFILDGFIRSNSELNFIVIGSTDNKYGKYLKKKYSKIESIEFLGPIYNIGILDDLRHFSALYFHGHTVGGTNPSLLEAMACSCLICANDNKFNREVLNDNAYFFSSASDISKLLNCFSLEDPSSNSLFQKNIERIKALYNWDYVVNEYDKHFMSISRT